MRYQTLVTLGATLILMGFAAASYAGEKPYEGKWAITYDNPDLGVDNIEVSSQPNPGGAPDIFGANDYGDEMRGEIKGSLLCLYSDGPIVWDSAEDGSATMAASSYCFEYKKFKNSPAFNVFTSYKTDSTGAITEDLSTQVFAAKATKLKNKKGVASARLKAAARNTDLRREFIEKRITALHSKSGNH